MNSNSVIKVLLVGTHLNSDAEPLNRLIATLANHVQADYLLIFSMNNKLVDCWFAVFLVHKVEIHGFELGIVCFDGISEFLTSFRFGQADSTDRRVGEDDRGDVVIFELIIPEFFRAKEAVGNASSSSNGDWSEQSLALTISDGKDV